MGREHAIRAKPGAAVRIWHVGEGRAAIGAKSIRAARISHVLQVSGTGDYGLAAVAVAQEGVVHRRQLMALGIGRGSIAHRLGTGKLHAAFPSVFFVGYPRSDPRSLAIAALLHAGDNCVLSHGTAAVLWGLAADPPDGVDLTLAGRHIRGRPGIRLHEVSALDLRDVRLHHGLPVTAPARTLLDHASTADDDELVRALAQARVQRLVSDRDLAAALERAPTRGGAAHLRRVLNGELAGAPTRSEAERRLLHLVAHAQLPAPETNVRLHGFEVDFLWRDARLVLEIDGYVFHSHRGAFERDRHRDQVLVAAGFRVIRVTWRQLCEEPLAVAVRIAKALDAA